MRPVTIPTAHFHVPPLPWLPRCPETKQLACPPPRAVRAQPPITLRQYLAPPREAAHRAPSAAGALAAMASPASAAAGDCLCESCCSVTISELAGREDTAAAVVAAVRRRHTRTIAAVEHMAPARAEDLAAAGAVPALLDVLASGAPAAAPTRLAYCAARAAFFVVHSLPRAAGGAAFAQRSAFARSVARVLRECERARLPARQQTFAGILCCALEALWPEAPRAEGGRPRADDGRALSVLEGTDVLVMSEHGMQLREALFGAAGCSRRYVFNNLVHVIARPQLYCQAEKALLGDADCLHVRAVSVLCKLILDDPPGVAGSARRVILREVPSALPIVMGVVRDAAPDSMPLLHALYTLRELLRDDDGDVRNVRELLRLAPDALSSFLRILTASPDERVVPPLLDVLFVVLPHVLATQEGAEAAVRSPQTKAALKGVAALLFPPPPLSVAIPMLLPPNRVVRRGAMELIRAICMSSETLFVQPLVAELYSGIGDDNHDVDLLLPRDFFNRRSARVARELSERQRVSKAALGVEAGASDARNAQKWREQEKLFLKWRAHKCEHCGRSDAHASAPSRFCNICQSSHFCTSRHQRAAWKHGHHEALCLKLHNLRLADAQLASHRSGDETPPLAITEDIEAHILELVKRAAKAGVPPYAIVIVVEMPAPMQSALARQRAEKMDGREYDLGPGRVRVTWVGSVDWPGWYSSRLMSLEMDLATFPSIWDREQAMREEDKCMERARKRWWEPKRESNGTASHASRQTVVDSTARPREAQAEAGGPSEETEAVRDGSTDCCSSLSVEAREYRVAWWEWTSAARRTCRFTNCSLPDDIPLPRISDKVPVVDLGRDISQEEVPLRVMHQMRGIIHDPSRDDLSIALELPQELPRHLVNNSMRQN